ncbi:hypothetical protein SSX86_023082 [Deinandra increscens subsp. villosa]|uniref:Gag-pol polyprotein n=1 Tax=Deinandra increscens subsp. villosa TaxID=3103831 RepID=A0AAP0GRS0_9ASTR
MSESLNISRKLTSQKHALCARMMRVAREQRRSDQKIESSSRLDKTKLKCSHCGMSKHTKKQCFRIVGYPEWWTDNHKRPGKTAAAVGGFEASGSGSSNRESGAIGFGGMADGSDDISGRERSLDVALNVKDCTMLMR